MKLGKWRKLGFQVGGDSIKVIPGAQDENVKFLVKLDSNFNRINNVFECLSKVDKSVYPDWEKGLIVDLQCHRFCGGKEFCQKVRNAMETIRTDKMGLETKVSSDRFIDYSRK